ncbi:MAG: Tol-Pal system beta propeller repeat protein TolB [Thermodesulfobacteriota bacterium]
MSRILTRIAGWVCIVLFLTGAEAIGADYDYINISNPFLKKIPIAVPVFKALNKSPAENSAAKSAADLLAQTLEYTGYFKIIDRAAFLVDPQDPSIDIPDIAFRNWTGIGAELLITGGILLENNMAEMELRLFDTIKAKLIVGKRYKGWSRDQRRIIQRFASDVIFSLTGDRGVFDSKIAFVSNGTGNKEVFICDFDGHSPRQVTQTNNITLSPAWSSDGKWLAYTAYTKGNPDLYIMNLEEKRGAVVSQKGLNMSPAWIPNQFTLAATLTFEGDPEIYMLTGSGKIIKRLTNNWGIDVSPSWSPDGKKMAFVSNRSGVPQIYIMDLYTGQTERLTFEGGYNTSPSWSPKGDRIAYAGMHSGKFDVYVITTDGQSLVQLTRDAGDNETPTWSPDGNLIAFSSTREGNSRIYVMTAYGTDQRRLLTLPGEQTAPSWSPRMMND